MCRKKKTLVTFKYIINNNQISLKINKKYF